MNAIPLLGVVHDAQQIGSAAVAALLDELDTYPKPGLVSWVDKGSHDDMDAAMFQRSAQSLRSYFAKCARCGHAGAGFHSLRRLGVQAEVQMLRATGGVNTHRGAIFALGLLAAAAGAGGADPCSTVRQRWAADILRHVRDAASHGSAAARRHGAGGAQAEAAAGFPAVCRVGLPAYRQALRAGLAPAAARVQTFFALLAEVQDTNLLHRGGLQGLQFAQDIASDFLARGGVAAADGWWRARTLHQALVARRLSPGGCADLLAATLFAHRYTSN